MNIGDKTTLTMAVLWPPLQVGAIVKYHGLAWKLIEPTFPGKYDTWEVVCLGTTDQAGVHRRAQDPESENW